MKSCVDSAGSVRACCGVGEGVTNRKLGTRMWGVRHSHWGTRKALLSPWSLRCLGDCTPDYVCRRISFQLSTVWWDCQTRGCLPSALRAEPISLSPGTLKPEDSERLAQMRFSSSPARCSMTCSILFMSHKDQASELPLDSAGRLTHGQWTPSLLELAS